jgi:hypothetical protein
LGIFGKSLTKLEVLDLCLISLSCAGIIGIALKFTAFWDHWVFFPWWPNLFDSVFLSAGALYLSFRALKRR